MKKPERNKKTDFACPDCGSAAINRKGKRKNQFQVVQLYQCKDCGKRFSNEKFKSKTYTASTIAKTISVYNTGLTIEKTAHKTKIPKSTIAKWIIENKEIFNLSKFNRQVQKYSQNNKIIEGHKYIHHLVYLYLQHNFKSDFFVKRKEPKLYNYLQKCKSGQINSELFTKSDARASRTKLNILKEIKVKTLKNNACKFANISVEMVTDNYKRHWVIEKLMIENDTSTIAIEVPVYLQISNSTIPWIRNIKSENDHITGHIDLLQYRNGKLYILDYKPNAEKEKPLGQLFVYACSLSKRTGIHFAKMKLAWFDENNYFETNAMEVYKYLMKNFK